MEEHLIPFQLLVSNHGYNDFYMHNNNIESSVIIEELPSSSREKPSSKINQKCDQNQYHLSSKNIILERRRKLDKMDSIPNRPKLPVLNLLHENDILAQGDRNYEIQLHEIEQLNLQECCSSSSSSDNIIDNNSDCISKPYNYTNPKNYCDEDASDEFSERSYQYNRSRISPIDEISERSKNSAVLHEMLKIKNQEARDQLERVLAASKNANVNRIKNHKPSSKLTKYKMDQHELKNSEQNSSTQTIENQSKLIKNIMSNKNTSQTILTPPKSGSSQSPRFKDFGMQIDEKYITDLTENESFRHLQSPNESYYSKKLSQTTFTYRDSSRSMQADVEKSGCCIKIFKCCMSGMKKSKYN